MHLWVLLLGLVSATLNNSHASEAAVELGGKTLEDLLNIKTTVATKKASSARSAPSVVTIITEEEIRNMGARDLIDVLRLVPSLHFAADTQGVVGLGVRGLWAQEGKYLLLIDGIEMNEIQFAGFQFGNEFPIRQIKRIEVIRGPGSVIYGGFAELAVINIITKQGADLKGINTELVYGQMTKTKGRSGLAIQGGAVVKKWDLTAAGFVGEAKRGVGTYTGYHSDPPPGFSGSFDFKDADTIKPAYLNLGASRRNFRLRFIFHQYALTSRAGYDFTGLDTNIPNDFRTIGLLANYDFRINSRLKITPQVQYLQQTPWRQLTEEARQTSSIYNLQSERIKASVTASYEASRTLSILSGFEHTQDQHKVKAWADTDGDKTFSTGKRSAEFSSDAFLGQVIWNVGLVNIALGARYEDPDFTSSSFVPRLGFTRAFKKWHYKALYAQAFRTPVLSNIDARPGIRPEKTETLEGELGHAVGREGYVTVNLFDTKIKDPIVYYYDPVLEDQYDNLKQVGSRGLEVDYRWKPSWGNVQAGYSYYQATNNNEQYGVEGKKSMFLAIPQHKVVFNSWINLTPQLKLNPSVIVMGDRYGYEYSSSEGGMAIQKTPARTLVHLYLQREDLLIKGLVAGLGVFNLLNQSVRYIQAYDGGSGSYPGPSREILGRIEYKRDF